MPSSAREGGASPHFLAAKAPTRCCPRVATVINPGAVKPVGGGGADAPHDAGPIAPAPFFLLAMGIAGTVLVLLSLTLEGPRRAGGEEPMDFVQYYFTGWQLGHGLPVYDPISVGGELARRVGWKHDSPLRTANPPAMVCLTWALARLPYPVAWWTVSVASLFALAGGSWFAARRSGWNASGAAAWAALAAGSAPTLAFVVLNHIEAPILLLGVGGWACLRRGRPRLGAACWGLAAALKLFPALWLLTLFHLRDRRVALVGLASAAAFTMLGAAAVGWDDTMSFIGGALPQASAWNSDPANISVRSLGAGLLGEAFGIVLSAAVAIGLLWAIFRGDRSVDRLWCLGLCGSLLLSPLSWSYYMVLAIPVAALVFARMDLAGAAAQSRFAIWVTALFFWPPLLGKWMPGADLAASLGWPWILVRHVPTFALLALAWDGHRRLGEPAAGAR